MQAVLPGGNGHLQGGLRLNEIVYLGAHNCAVSKCYGWIYAQQNVSITDQFEKYGARHFKVPIHWYLSGNNPEIVIAHENDGGSNCKLSILQRAFRSPEKASDRLKELVDLAFKYPKEIMIVKIESSLMYNSKSNGTHGWDPQLIGTMLHSLFTQVRLDQKAIMFNGNMPPTLDWCRENNKNVLVTIEPQASLIGQLKSYVHFSYQISAQVDWEADPLEEVTHGKIRRGTTNNNDGSIWSPFLEIHMNPEVSFRPDSQYRDKYNSYNHVRRRFLTFNQFCSKMPNFIAADFIDQGSLTTLIDDVNAIINSNGKFLPELFALL